MSVPVFTADPKQTIANLAPHNWLEELAAHLAQHSEPSKSAVRRSPLPARMKQLEVFLTAAHRYFEETSQIETSTSHTAEWMLDNFYIIEQTLRQVSRDIPSDFYHRLPKLKSGSGQMARIYALAFTLTKATEGHLEVSQIKSFINLFQNITFLQIGENWALPPMLRLSVLEVLAEALASVTRLNFLPAPFFATWADMPDDRRSQPRVDDETRVIYCILSLRMLATQNWRDFFEEISVVEKILRTDPVGVYSQMDFETRNRYRNRIENLALGSSMDESGIAHEALCFAQNGDSPRACHIGFYLVGEGRALLEGRIGYQPSFASRLQRKLSHHVVAVFLGSILTFTIFLCLAAAGYAFFAGGSFLQFFLVCVLSLVPASALAVNLVNGLVTQIMPPRILPRLNFQDGVPPEASVMVVIPALLKNKDELEFLLCQMENHHLGNADPNIRFTLLTDFEDAPQKELPGEADLIQTARESIARLNLRYGGDGTTPFYLFHRERIWNPKEGCWMGWERKRGKLVEFNSLLNGRERSAFTVQTGDLRTMPRIPFVVTLDADVTMPRDCVRHLAGILAHPLNQPEFNPETGALADGYTVIQPRVQVRPNVANRSLFSRVYSGDITLDLYTRAVSDVYQDLFGEGNYIGKGIYHVAAFDQCLSDRVPDNTLLSHDLFEGIHGRCALATHITLYEDYPPHYLTYAYRLHRWVRGDWQLLPWLLPHVPHKAGNAIEGSFHA